MKLIHHLRGDQLQAPLGSPNPGAGGRHGASSSYLANTFLAIRARAVLARRFRSVRPGCFLLLPLLLLLDPDEPRSTPVAASTSLINSGSCQSAKRSQDSKTLLTLTREPLSQALTRLGPLLASNKRGGRQGRAAHPSWAHRPLCHQMPEKSWEGTQKLHLVYPLAPQAGR